RRRARGRRQWRDWRGRPGQRHPGAAAPQLPARAMRRNQQPAFANPVLIGAVTVLVAVVAVFLAYNATNGLPFVPTRQLKVDFTNIAALVDGNDVREVGFRVGVVSEMKRIVLRNIKVVAKAILLMDSSKG